MSTGQDFLDGARSAPGEAAAGGPGSNIDPEEVNRFSRMAEEWWNPAGKFKPLHAIGPARLEFLRDAACAHFDRSPHDLRPLRDLRVADVGCGGGLISEPMARMGAAVTGIDPSERNIAIARAHAKTSRLAIDYRATDVESLAAAGEAFDIVACLEVVEHVPDVGRFVAMLADITRPGGLLVLSTINRTAKAFALAIVGAEYVLRWLPRGTHSWDKFVTPAELRDDCVSAGLEPGAPRGMVYRPLSDRWVLDSDTDVNYLLSATRPGAPGKPT